MKYNYFGIPLAVLAVSLWGSFFSTRGLAGWYQTLHLPSWTPPGNVIGIVWTIIFILCGISLLLLWNQKKHSPRFWWIIGIFILNGLLNVFWSYLFFSQHLLYLAFWEAGILGLSVVALILLIWPLHRRAALLLIPYAGWVFFATYLTYAVAQLNP